MFAPIAVDCVWYDVVDALPTATQNEPPHVAPYPTTTSSFPIMLLAMPRFAVRTCAETDEPILVVVELTVLIVVLFIVPVNVVFPAVDVSLFFLLKYNKSASGCVKITSGGLNNDVLNDVISSVGGL